MEMCEFNYTNEIGHLSSRIPFNVPKGSGHENAADGRDTYFECEKKKSFTLTTTMLS
jgi:hypothetical protein